MKNIARAVATGVTALLVGTSISSCSSLIKASDAYGKGAPDAVKSVDDVLVGHVQTVRTREVLGWNDSPHAILSGAPHGVPYVGGTAVDDYTLAQRWICETSGQEHLFALNVIDSFGKGLAKVTKAPDDGLVPALKAIEARQKNLNDISEAADKSNESKYPKQRIGCLDQVKRLYEGKFVVQVSQFPGPSRFAAGGKFLDLFFSAYGVLKTAAGLVEQQVRTELIKSYIASNKSRVLEALDFMDGKFPENASPAERFTLKDSVDDQLRLHLVLSLLDVNYAGRVGAGTPDQRDAVARAVAEAKRFEDLASVDVEKDVQKPFGDAIRKLIAASEDPSPDFDGFMTAMSSIRDSRDKFFAARQAWIAR